MRAEISPAALPAAPFTKRIEAGALIAIAILSGIVVPLLVIGRGAASILVPVIGGLVAALFLSSPLKLRALWPGGALAYSVAVMLAVLLVSVAGSIKPGFSLAIWFQLAGLIVLVAALPLVLEENPTCLSWTLRILVLTSLVGAAVAAASIYLWPPLLSYVRPVDTPTSYHAALRLKSYGAVMPCVAPVLLWAGFRLGGFWRPVAIAAVVLGAAVVYGVHNRAAFGGYAGAVGAMLLLVGFRRIKPSLRVTILAALAVAIGAIGTWVVVNLPTMPFDPAQPAKLPDWLIDPHRQVIWGFVLDRAVERPWFGWGLSTANFLPGANDKIPVIGQTFVPLHAHNWMLQIFSDAGGVGLMAVAVALFLFLRKIYSSAVGMNAASCAAFSLSGAFFVSTLANFSIWQGWWQSVFVVLIPLTLAASRSLQPPAESKLIGAAHGTEAARSYAAVRS